MKIIEKWFIVALTGMLFLSGSAAYSMTNDSIGTNYLPPEKADTSIDILPSSPPLYLRIQLNKSTSPAAAPACIWHPN